MSQTRAAQIRALLNVQESPISISNPFDFDNCSDFSSDLFTGNSSGQSPLDAKVERIVTDALKQFNVAGLALAVIDGENIWEMGYGYADIAASRRVNPDTLFLAGSTTKIFTAAAAAVLVDDTANHGDIVWDTPMSTLLPEDFVLQSEYATNHVTIEDCLSHRSGISGHHAHLGAQTVGESTRSLRHLSFDRELRTEWQYSNHMYWAVSHMIEVQTGMGLEEFMMEKLWDPLAMHSTFLSVKSAQDYERKHPEVCLAKPYIWDEAMQKYLQLPYWDDTGMSGAGAMVSNIRDQAKWVRCFINRQGPLSKESFEDLTTPHMVMPAINPRFQGPHCCGMGWFISHYHGELVLFHPGGTIGFSANVIFLPNRNWGVVGMCNGSSEGILDVPMWHLIDEYLEIPQEKRIDVLAGAKQRKQGMKLYAETARERLYPWVRRPAIPASLSKREYVGFYVHPAYGTLTVTLSDGDLRGHLPGRGTQDLNPITFEHVNGDFYLAKADIFDVMSFRLRARFEINASGLPARLGVEFTPGDIVWFARDFRQVVGQENKATGFIGRSLAALADRLNEI